MSEIIDIKNIPIEPTITIFNPDGSELITTNDANALYYIRLQIKQKHLSGYTIKTNSSYDIPIHNNGKVEFYPEDEVTGCENDKLLMSLL